MFLTTWVHSSDPESLCTNDPVLALVLNMPIFHYICIGCVCVMRLSNHQKSLWTFLHGHVGTTFETITFQNLVGKI